MKMKEELGKMAQDHWDWVEGLLKKLTSGTTITIEIVQYLYKTALIHGYGHAVIDFSEGKADPFLPSKPGIKYD